LTLKGEVPQRDSDWYKEYHGLKRKKEKDSIGDVCFLDMLTKKMFERGYRYSRFGIPEQYFSADILEDSYNPFNGRK